MFPQGREKMIDNLSKYTMAIVCSSFMMNLIQMILPNGNSKKYVLFVCGVIMAIILISPVITFLNEDYHLEELLSVNEEKLFEVEKEKYEEYYENEVIHTYQSNIQNGIVERLKKAGYKVHNIQIEYDKVTMEPESLRLEIESMDGTVQPVRIEVSSFEISNNDMSKGKNSSISAFEKLRLEKILKEEYGFEAVEINE